MKRFALVATGLFPSWSTTIFDTSIEAQKNAAFNPHPDQQILDSFDDYEEALKAEQEVHEQLSDYCRSIEFE